MSKLASNNNKALGPWTSVPFSPKLAYYYNGTKWYYPLIKPTSTLTWAGYVYSYDRSVGDTFGISLSNTKYVVPNKRVQEMSYDIPAGTYSPSTFENLIANYISQNGSRTVKNSFSVKVDGQTYDVPVGRAICYTSQYAGNARFVTFSGKQRDSEQFDYNKQFSTQGVYCVYWGNYWTNQGKEYNKFSIQVTGGIKFS